MRPGRYCMRRSQVLPGLLIWSMSRLTRLARDLYERGRAARRPLAGRDPSRLVLARKKSGLTAAGRG